MTKVYSHKDQSRLTKLESGALRRLASRRIDPTAIEQERAREICGDIQDDLEVLRKAEKALELELEKIHRARALAMVDLRGLRNGAHA